MLLGSSAAPAEQRVRNAPRRRVLRDIAGSSRAVITGSKPGRLQRGDRLSVQHRTFFITRPGVRCVWARERRRPPQRAALGRRSRERGAAPDRHDLR